VRGPKLEERLLAFIISWKLTPRGSNHVLLNEGDIFVIYGIQKTNQDKQDICIKEYMLKSKRLFGYKFSYVVIVSKILTHFKVNVDVELSNIIREAPHEITNVTLHEMGFAKVNGSYTIKDDEENVDALLHLMVQYLNLLHIRLDQAILKEVIQ